MPDASSRIRVALDRVGRLGPGLVVVLAGAFALRRLDNTDTWWHLAGGRWIVEHGRVPYLDPLSYTVSDHPWINVQWLFDLLIYGLHQLGGPSLLVLTATAAYAAAIAIMVTTMRARASALVTTVIGAWVVIASQDRFAIRPEMATFLCLQLVLWVYATGRRADSRRLWLLVPIMMLWANMHGLFSVGIVVILCQLGALLGTSLGLVPAAWRAPHDPVVAKRVVGSGLAAIAATAVGPFWFEGMAFPFVLMARVSGDDPVFRSIGEFRSPWEGYFVTLSITLYQVLFVVGIVTVSLAALVAWRATVPGKARSNRAERRRAGITAMAPPPSETPTRPMTFDVADLAVFVGLAYLSLLARRNVALFALGSAPFLAGCLQGLLDAMGRRVDQDASWVARVGSGLCVSLLVAATWFVASNGYYRWNGELHEFGLGVLEAQFPRRGAAFAREHGLPGPIFNDFTNGGYLNWAEPVPGGVFIDGRTEVYEVEFFKHYTRMLQQPAVFQEDVDRRGVQTVFFFHWWPNHQTLVRTLLRDSRWALVFFDHTSIVLVRRDGNEDLIARTQAAFEPVRRELETALLAPARSWQWPVGHVRAVQRYAVILDQMGRTAEARPFYEHLLTLGPSDTEAIGALLRLAQMEAAGGSRALAQRYLDLAAERDPTSPRVAQLRAQIGR